ncbi:Calcium-dependent secretion activator 2 [Liparis tanakae]|uniref:Calcium-dependent secretion activator 2 n=1 Tax=Liparis tanakae TaxID=230148 RepID=A0A4Z2DY30_9TELE|nr:Calcium-dependent secretion activator 2 [Liparis tanakae]
MQQCLLFLFYFNLCRSFQSCACIITPPPPTPQGFMKSERVSRMVHSGGCSAADFREVFKKNIERRVRSLPEIDGLSKETVLSSWIAKYDAIYRGDEEVRRQPPRAHLGAAAELILSKEQLYHMFQQILGVRKFEHQLLYNACQVSAGRVCDATLPGRPGEEFPP